MISAHEHTCPTDVQTLFPDVQQVRTGRDATRDPAPAGRHDEKLKYIPFYDAAAAGVFVFCGNFSSTKREKKKKKRSVKYNAFFFFIDILKFSRYFWSVESFIRPVCVFDAREKRTFFFFFVLRIPLCTRVIDSAYETNAFEKEN